MLSCRVIDFRATRPIRPLSCKLSSVDLLNTGMRHFYLRLTASSGPHCHLSEWLPGSQAGTQTAEPAQVTLQYSSSTPNFSILPIQVLEKISFSNNLSHPTGSPVYHKPHIDTRYPNFMPCTRRLNMNSSISLCKQIFP